MYNFLVYLDQNLFIDDEQDRVERKKITDAIRTLETDVNMFGFKPEKEYEALDHFFEEHGQNPESAGRYARNKLFNLALYWIDFYSKNPVQDWRLDRDIFGVSVDPRNEIARNRCIEVWQKPQFSELLRFYGHDIDYNRRPEDIYELAYSEFMKEMNWRMHKTNQQTATSLMLYALQTSTDDRAKKIVDSLRNEYGRDYWRLPMI